MVRFHNKNNPIYFRCKFRRREIALIIFGSIVATLLVFGAFLFFIPISDFSGMELKAKLKVGLFLMFYMALNLYLGLNPQTFSISKEGITFYFLCHAIRRKVTWDSIEAVHEKLSSKGELKSIVLKLKSSGLFKKIAIFTPLNKPLVFLEEVNKYSPENNPLGRVLS